MGINSVINLYIKERKYEEETFGNYANNKSLNLASFITFLETYVIRAKKTYTKKWVEDLPAWMLSSQEEMLNGSTPVETYECLIKIMALAGAALESYVEINPEKWREKERIDE